MEKAGPNSNGHAKLVNELYVARQRVAWLEQTIEQMKFDTSTEEAAIEGGRQPHRNEKGRLDSPVVQKDRMITAGMLAAGVAHEINNPLSYVLSNLVSLSEELPRIRDVVRRYSTRAIRQQWDVFAIETDLASLADEEVLEQLLCCTKEAIDGARRIRDIVRDFSSFARFEKNAREYVDLNRVVLRSVAIVSNEIEHRARLTKSLGDIPLIVADEGLLCQVLVNILVNATQAIENGNIAANEIAVSTWADKKEVVVKVSDTGRGIAPEHTEMIFEPFFTTKPADLGTGLGLCICRKIVDCFNGRIEVDSKLGLGSTFSVHLPIYANSG